MRAKKRLLLFIPCFLSMAARAAYADAIVADYGSEGGTLWLAAALIIAVVVVTVILIKKRK